MAVFIGVHAGAGLHSEARSAEFKKLMKQACIEGEREFRSVSVTKGNGQNCMTEPQTGSCVAAAIASTVCLENHSLTNAGKGSSLNMRGDVECDACVVDGSTGLHAAVGAVPGCLSERFLRDLSLI